MRLACSLLLRKHGRVEGGHWGEPHVTGVGALPMVAGTPLIRGNSSLVNCEIGRPLTALGPVEQGLLFHSWEVAVRCEERGCWA